MRFWIVIFLLVGCAEYAEIPETATPSETIEFTEISTSSIEVYIEIGCVAGNGKAVVIENTRLEAFTLDIDGIAHYLEGIQSLRLWTTAQSRIQVTSAIHPAPTLPEIEDCTGTETPEPISAQADLSIRPIIRAVDCTGSGSPHPPSSDTIGVTILNQGGVDTGRFRITGSRFSEPVIVDNIAAELTVVLLLPDWVNYYDNFDWSFDIQVDVDNTIPESDEENNRLQAYTGCVRPT